MFSNYLITFISVASTVLQGVILLYILGSWVVARDNKVYLFIESLAKSILAPFRKIFPSNGMIDVAPMVAFLVIEVVAEVLIALLGG